MKKLIAVLIIGLCLAASGPVLFAVLEGPIIIKDPVVLIKDKITVDENTGSTKTENKVAEYVDDQTVDIVTTITTTQAVQSQTFDRAVLQTELDHINSDGIPQAQKRMDDILARKAELILILGVFDNNSNYKQAQAYLGVPVGKK